MSIAHKLSVWEKAHELTLAVHRAEQGAQSRTFTPLAATLQRLSIAIVVHIVEGAESETPDGFIDHIEGAIALTRELDYLLLLASDLGAIGRSHRAKLEARSDQVRRMLAGLRTTIRRRVTTTRRGARAGKGKLEGEREAAAEVSGERSAHAVLPRDTKRR